MVCLRLNQGDLEDFQELSRLFVSGGSCGY
jgi:hypothetical protein